MPYARIWLVFVFIGVVGLLLYISPKTCTNHLIGWMRK